MQIQFRGYANGKHQTLTGKVEHSFLKGCPGEVTVHVPEDAYGHKVDAFYVVKV